MRFRTPMIAVVVALLAALRSTIRSRAELAAEILALRHQLAVYWLWKPRSRGPGRPAIDADVRGLIRDRHTANPLWGAPRVHGEWRTFGIAISQATVAKYLGRCPRTPPSHTWRTFLSNHVSLFASLDFFTVPTATLRVPFVFVVLSHDRRRIVNVTAHLTVAWTAQQIRKAWPWDEAPQFVIRDREGIYGEAFGDAEQALGIQEILIAPRSPWQNPYVERLIGSTRRECIGHVVIWNERMLRRHLQTYLAYDHRWWTHLSLDKDAPIPRARQPSGDGRIVAVRHLGGLHHDERIAA